jgi:DNA replicative helicase MCM subunit Mcm2 (Cdc46/Mcm family)
MIRESSAPAGAASGQMVLLPQLWQIFFPKERYDRGDRRVIVVEAFIKCLSVNFQHVTREVIDSIINRHSILVNIQYLCKESGFPDCLSLLCTEPANMIGCIGCAVSVLLSQRLSVFNNNKLYPIAIHPRFFSTTITTTYRLGSVCAPVADLHSNCVPLTPFVDVKSNAVGKLVCIIGYVMRMTKIQPLVEYGSFICGKCGKQTLTYFEDGIYTSTDRCATPNCGGRSLVLDRQSSRTIDSRYVKLQEIENFSSSAYDQVALEGDLSAPRGVPRTLEIEIREDLVNYSCIAGDIMLIIGVVRSIQDRTPNIQRQPGGGGGGGRWGGRGGRGGGGGGAKAESGMYALTILANSMTTLGSVPAAKVVHVPNYATCRRQLLKRSFVAMEGKSDTDVDDIESDKDTHLLSRHKATGNYILDQNFQTNTACGSEAVSALTPAGIPSQATVSGGTGDGVSDNISRVPGTINSAFETDDMSSYVDASNASNHLALFTTQELTAIREIGTLPAATLLPLLLNSLCPTIYGNEIVKLGLMLGLLGGTRHDHDRDHADSDEGSAARVVGIRSDIHILLMGDPGLGKSQLLRAVEKVAPKCVLVCGNTTTTAGLTVTLCRDGSDVSMEAGALVLADQGICCIDELDKISCDVHALLECMEQQQISIAKSGMITSLPARTSVFAAANPVGGHYNRNRSVSRAHRTQVALFHHCLTFVHCC